MEETTKAPAAEKTAVKEKKPKKPKPEYATVEQFNQLAEMLTGIAKRLDEKTAPVKDEAAPISDPASDVAYTPLDPQVRKTVDEILGKDFGVELRYNNGVPIIDIVVPLDKSNAKPEYLEMHKVDRRSTSIAPGARTVKEWCQMIKKNLEHPR
jgi:hypothetical protein